MKESRSGTVFLQKYLIYEILPNYEKFFDLLFPYIIELSFGFTPVPATGGQIKKLQTEMKIAHT